FTYTTLFLSSEKEEKKGIDFFPLTVDLRDSFAAVGRFPGGFIKREGRPNDKEILSSRLIDRTLRPLFPEGYHHETQIICQVLSSDGENDGDVIGGFGASEIGRASCRERRGSSVGGGDCEVTEEDNEVR